MKKSRAAHNILEKKDLFKMLRTLSILCIIAALANASLFSSSKHSFKEGDVINLKVNGLSSAKTHIPYEYDYLPFPMVFLNFIVLRI